MADIPATTKAKIKGLLLVLFLVGVIILFRLTPLKEIITPERIKSMIAG